MTMAGNPSPNTPPPSLSATTEERDGSETGAERRAHERFELDLDAGLSRDGKLFVPCKIRDFCLGGMLIVPSEGSEENTLVGGEVVASGDSLIVKCAAEVDGKRHEHKARIQVARVSNRGIGVAFDRGNPDEVWRITELVRKLKAALLEGRARDRDLRAPCSPMAVEQAVNTSQLLEETHRRVQGFLASGLEATFQKADDRLFSRSKEATSNSDQTEFFDAMKEVKGLRVSVESAFFDVIDREVAGLGQPTPQGGSSAAEEGDMELALMDTGSFDDWLSTKNIISAAEPVLKKLQFELEQRLSQLLNTAIDEENNPVGLTHLCQTFHDSIQNLGATRQSRQAMIEGFDLAIVQNLEELYGDLNTMLSEGGVESSSRRVPRPAASSDMLDEAELETAEASADENASGRSDFTSSDSSAESSLGDSEPGTVPAGNSAADATDFDGNTSDHSDDRARDTLPPLRLGKAFRAAGSLIALQDESSSAASDQIGQFLDGLGVSSSAPTPSTVTTEQKREVLDSLSILQRSPRFARSSESTPLDLKQTLDATWRSAGLDVGSDHRMMVAIVSNLIDAILDDPYLSEEVKKRVRRLAVPVLKVAIQDDGFFDNQMHPARQVLDSLGRVDAQDVECMEKVVDPIVDDIVGKYETDAAIFANALVPLKSNLSKQRRIYQQNLERVVTEREEQQSFIKARQKDSGESSHGTSKSSPRDGDAKAAIQSGLWSRWLAEAQRCKPGDVLSMVGSDGHPQKLSLAWVSEDKGTLVLVDSQGNKAMSLTDQELAMHIKRGTAVVEDAAEMALTDRGTYNMLRTLHKRLSRSATHDRLTDVLTRKEFEARLEELITAAVRDASRHVMYVLEIDGVQRVVEKAGQKTGKQLLKKLAEVIEKQVAKRGVVGRLGAVRFGVLLNDAGMDDARKIIERQCLTIAKSRCMWHGEVLPLTASVGMLEVTPMSQGLTATLAAAESTVERIVEAGSNRIELIESFADPHEAHGLHGAGCTTVLDMLGTDRLQLRCQRVVPLMDDHPAGPHYEILLGVKQDGGTVSLPADFIRAAERNHEMETVDRWVISTTFAWLKNNPEKLDSVDGYSINLSPNTLSDSDVLEFVLTQFSKTMIPPAKIIFEFPETGATANIAFTTDFVTTLSTYGCRFAIDDFGMAESSFSYLSSLPVDFVKIDGKLVVDILESPKDLAVVKSINEIGHLLGKQTIAEFVENDAILARVRDLGVDYAQGFGVEKPGLLESI
jgi:diguanylate cyclase (GGDEF)-like protein